MTSRKVRQVALEIAQKWYQERYGGYHWGTADEIVEDFLIWLLEKVLDKRSRIK